ncbi:8323_t:CDS:2 [Scutellospora calospora]|uniref:8323_t:CDS:1 n=1 Tax=Scutellospora calospora TaxID=85575 RepID=A0ACA9K667_9GLOM|nr:8323_t:CDS:2 [Scutellospora calospora]
MSRTLISPLIKSTFHCSCHKSIQPHLLSIFKRVCSYSRSNIERLDMLKKVYLPLLTYKEETQEWSKLIKSGKAEYTDFLKAIDSLKASSRISSVDILKGLTKNFSLNDFLKNIDTPLPALSSLSDKLENEVIKVQNHLLATYFLYNTFYKLDHEINLDEVPALMERFIQFRDKNQNSSLHPLIIASRILLIFLYINPFADEEYTSTLFLAQAEKDSILLYALVVQNIFNILMRYQA